MLDNAVHALWTIGTVGTTSLDIIAISSSDVVLMSPLQEDEDIKAVAVVHNETATGVTSDIPRIRQTINDAGSDALLLVRLRHVQMHDVVPAHSVGAGTIAVIIPSPSTLILS